MNHVHQLDEWIEVAQKLGYHIRYDYFGGTGGGVCQYGGKKWLFIDLALPPQEQLDLISTTLNADPLLDTVKISSRLREEISHRRVA